MASEYRQIHPRLWDSVRGMDGDVQRMVFYCLTAPGSNGAGIFVMSCALAGEYLGLATSRCLILVGQVCDTLDWRYDQDARVLYIPTWWRWNCPHNSKHMIGCLRRLESLPRTPLLQEFASNETYLEHAPAGVLDTFRQRIAKVLTGYPIQNPNPNPDPNPNQNPEQNPNPDRDRAEPDLLEDLKSDRAGANRFRQVLVLHLCLAFGLQDGAAGSQKRAFGSVARRVQDLADREGIARELVELAQSKAKAGLDNPMAAWQAAVDKQYPKRKAPAPAG